jgi:hypothetical protein
MIRRRSAGRLDDRSANRDRAARLHAAPADGREEDLSDGRRSLGFVYCLCASVLASCVSPEELRREDEATCAGDGFHPGTDAFATCLQRESLARRAITGMDFSPNLAAAAALPCPAISTPSSSTRTGFVHPHLRMDADNSLEVGLGVKPGIVRIGYQLLDRPVLDLVGWPPPFCARLRGPRSYQ